VLVDHRIQRAPTCQKLAVGLAHPHHNAGGPRMLIAKVGLTVAFASAGLWFLSSPLIPAETEVASSAQSTYEQLAQTVDFDHLAAAQAEF
jgi:hypothetical protein